MAPNQAKLRLIWHGVFLFLLGLLSGAFVPIMTNPKAGLSAHLGGVLDGMFLMLLGLFWSEIRLSGRLETTTFWLMLYAAYAGWEGLLLAAFFGTSRATPIAGEGYVAAWWQESLVEVILISFAIAILIGCGLVLYGLRRKQSPGEPGVSRYTRHGVS